MSYLDPPRIPGTPALNLGVLFPIFVVLLEAATGLCAGVLFDPLPTAGHVVVVLLVPAINFALWMAARREGEEPHHVGTLIVAGGAATTIAAIYSLMMLPILPFALVAILFVGIGLLPFAPVLAMIVACRLTGALAAHHDHVLRRGFAGAALGFCILLLVDTPSAATQLAVTWSLRGGAEATRGVALMRAIGDEDALLRLCYEDNRVANGPLTFALSSWRTGLFSGDSGTSTAAARELYFRATGQPFNHAERPRSRHDTRFMWDEDRGGEQVAGRVRDLSLASSRLDASIASQDNLAYFEWTMEFANASAIQQEARLALGLPEGAVVSRATLWVNGEPREASIAGRGAARQAYQNVVSASRDPLLVTTDGAGRALVQAFPVQPGSSLKLRVGVTAPLEIAADGRRKVALPAIVERNFNVADSLHHAVWIEGDGPLSANGAPFARDHLADGDTRMRGSIVDAMLQARGIRILAPQIAAPVQKIATLSATAKEPAISVVQSIDRQQITPPRTLAFLLDGSAANRPAALALRTALDRITAGQSVALVIADEEPVIVPAAPWSSAQRDRIRHAIDATSFTGGKDNAPALARALELAGEASSTLIWVHGPQPVSFNASRATIQQVLDRQTLLPRLIRYQPANWPAFTIEGESWFDTAQSVQPSGNMALDLASLVSDAAYAGARWKVARRPATAADAALPVGSSHILRLWAADEIAALPSAAGKARDDAITLAHRLNIVTPVSGAVVLETDKDYKEAGLPVPPAGDVPTLPEPGTWALLLIVFLLLAWMRKRLPRGVAI
ncbi:hypothetical protein ACFB49_29520 [Sphingomonas sp. DBB INV C78]|uniref:VIT domain-containing protein n=1 Tax=Sphingomonas sp. DBB INV C78 TaxID=3349434 RepID=UPI0036D3FA15